MVWSLLAFDGWMRNGYDDMVRRSVLYLFTDGLYRALACRRLLVDFVYMSLIMSLVALSP